MGLAPRIIRNNDLAALTTNAVGRLICRDVDSFVFVATTGRTGTQSLSAIFSAVEGFRAFHEPHPIMNGAVLERAGAGDAQFIKNEFFRFKLPGVYWRAKFSKGYFESNHLFIKTFADETAEALGDRLKAIYLFRDPDAVASSYFNRHPPQGAPGANAAQDPDIWVLRPDAKTNLLDMADLLERRDPRERHYLRFVWYSFETEARATDFHLRHPEIRMVALDTADLNNLEKLKALFSDLDIPKPANLEGLVGTRANASARKPALPAGVDPAASAAFQAACRSRLDALGLSWPGGPVD
ncbi:MAG: hypothetical protein ACE5FO_08495 [Parvularculaceae bacterium]